MKLSKEELLEKVKTYVGDRADDETLEIIEDISDSFESSKENFDLDKSMKILSDVRLENGKKKFERNQLIKIENSLKGEPKKWDSVSKLAKSLSHSS